jgi:GGDEF domain-containing protein
MEDGGTAAPISHHLVRLKDGPEGAPRFFGVIRAADRGTAEEDETMRRCLGSSDGRSGLQAHLTHLAETLDSSAHVAVCALGVDGMREFCRVYGYDTGEVLLRAVGRRLLQALPDHAVLARIGGAKYAAVLLGDDADALRAQAESLA